MGVLEWSPTEFWQSTLRDFLAAVRGRAPRGRISDDDREDLYDALMQAREDTA